MSECVAILYFAFDVLISFITKNIRAFNTEGICLFNDLFDACFFSLGCISELFKLKLTIYVCVGGEVSYWNCSG